MQPHPSAPDHLPWFIAAPGETDVLMVVMAIFLILAVLGIGIVFFRLHALPDQIAHKGKKVQFQIVCVLCLLALFTHIHLFWVAALLLALIDIPDFGGMLGRIVSSLESIAGSRPRRQAKPGAEIELSDREVAATASEENQPSSGRRREMQRA